MVQYLVLSVVYIENLKCLVTELEVTLGTELYGLGQNILGGCRFS